MRKLLFLPALMGVLVFCLGGAAQANLLLNPSLEMPGLASSDIPTNWTMSEGPLAPPVPPFTGAPNDTLQVPNFGVNSNHDGSRGLWLRTFRGGQQPGAGENRDKAFGHLTQTVAHVPMPGMNKYVFTGWARFEQNSALGAVNLDGDRVVTDPLVDPTQASDMMGGRTPSRGEFAIEFLDAGGMEISKVVLILDDSNVPNDDHVSPNATLADAMWSQHMVMGFAPLGTASVRVRASMIDGVFNVDPRQSGFYDDFSLIKTIPEPTSVLLGLIGVLGLVGLTRRRR